MFYKMSANKSKYYYKTIIAFIMPLWNDKWGSVFLRCRRIPGCQVTPALISRDGRGLRHSAVEVRAGGIGDAIVDLQGNSG